MKEDKIHITQYKSPAMWVTAGVHVFLADIPYEQQYNSITNSPFLMSQRMIVVSIGEEDVTVMGGAKRWWISCFGSCMEA
jgi:hypothetical protein